MDGLITNYDFLRLSVEEINSFRFVLRIIQHPRPNFQLKRRDGTSKLTFSVSFPWALVMPKQLPTEELRLIWKGLHYANLVSIASSWFQSHVIIISLKKSMLLKPKSARRTRKPNDRHLRTAYQSQCAEIFCTDNPSLYSEISILTKLRKCEISKFWSC